MDPGGAGNSRDAYALCELNTQSPPAMKALTRRQPRRVFNFAAHPVCAVIAHTNLISGRPSVLSLALFRAFSDVLLSGCAKLSAASHNRVHAREDRQYRPTRMPADMDEYVTVATFDKATDAHIALGRLAVEGVHAVLFDDNMVQMDWLYAIALGGIKLRVQRVDAARARRILATDYSQDLENLDVGKPDR